jgi:hypothetical protein
VVEVRENLGSELLLHVAVDAPAVRAEAVKAAMSDDATDAPPATETARLVARVQRGCDARPRSTIELAFAAANLRFFDLETGLAVG